MANGKMLWTPDGVRSIGGPDPTRVELNKHVGEWLRQFADVAAALGLGIHCHKCGGPLVGRNSETDKVYAQTCGCREFIWENREYRRPTDLRM